MNLDFQRCIDDFPYYSANVLKIKNIKAELIPLVLNDPQVRLHKMLERLKNKNKLQRAIILKARREGISTYAEGRLFHCSHFNEYTDSLVIAHDKESGGAIFKMCKLYFDCLPQALRPMIRYSSKKEIVFENPDPKTRYANPGLRSSITVTTAGKKDTSRGAGYHNLHCSEVSSWQFAADVIPALIPTIPMTDKSIIIYESTAKGVGNFFHNEWLRACEGESTFQPFFLAWFDLPEYSREFNTSQERDVFGQTLNEEEKELTATYNISLEQLQWRRVTIATLHGDMESFRQEYPATAEEAFIVSGTPIFDRRRLRDMALLCTEPKFRGVVTPKGFVPEDHGEFQMWEPPQQKQVYCLGVDVSDGGPGGDYSCIEIFKKLPPPYFAEQVGEWHGRIDPYNLAFMVGFLGTVYNKALVAIEVNAHGLATQQELQTSYWNLYQQTYLDRYDQKLSTKVGWETTLRTKALLISFATHCISDKTIIIRSSALIRECMTYI